MSKSRIVVCAALGLLACLGWASPAQLHLALAPVFVGSQKSFGVIPLAVSIANDGRDAAGVVHIQGEEYTMDYPVELPQGSSKDLVVYVPGGYNAYSATVDLNTNQGSISKPIDPAGMTTTQGDYFLQIGGNPGDLSFLQDSNAEKNDQITCGFGYVDPEKAPDRLAAYAGCNVILLASGAERLSDETVAALKLYVLQGGQLVFPGGVASPLLSDGRWQDVFPVQPKQPKLISDDSLMREIAATNREHGKTLGKKIGKPYSIIDFEPASGSAVVKQGSQNLIAAKDYGCGKVVFWGFDPLHGAVREWPGLRRFFLRSSHMALPGQGSGLHLSEDSTDQPEYFHGPSSYGYGGRPSASSAFQVTMPTIGRVATILGLYFLFVIPLNFVLLQKLKRREWGWTSAATISLVFGGIMLAQAKDLYGLKTSHCDRLMLIAQQGAQIGVATGTSEMFTASGGSYDLKMKGVDSLNISNDNEWGRRAPAASFSPVDVGSILIPSAQFKNLGFEKLGYQQVFDSSHLATIRRVGSSYSVKAGTDLENAVLIRQGSSMNIGAGKQGRTLSVKSSEFVPIAKSAQVPGGPEGIETTASSIAHYLQPGQVALMASCPDAPVGPELGKRVEPAPTLVMFAEVGQ